MRSGWKRSFGMAVWVMWFWVSVISLNQKIHQQHEHQNQPKFAHPMIGLEHYVHQRVPIQCQELQLCSVNKSATFSRFRLVALKTQKNAKIHMYMRAMWPCMPLDAFALAWQKTLFKTTRWLASSNSVPLNFIIHGNANMQSLELHGSGVLGSNKTVRCHNSCSCTPFRLTARVVLQKGLRSMHSWHVHLYN